MISRKTITQNAALLAITALPLAVHAQPAFTDLLPEDTLLAIWTPDYPALEAATKASPYGALMLDEANADLRQYLLDAMTEAINEDSQDPESFEKFQQFVANLDGRAGVIVLLPDNLDGTDAGADVFMVFETSEQGLEFAETLFQEQRDDLESVTADTFTAAGVTAKRLRGTSLTEMSTDPQTGEETPVEETYVFATVGNTVIMQNGASEDPLKALLARLKGETQGPAAPGLMQSRLPGLAADALAENGGALNIAGSTSVLLNQLVTTIKENAGQQLPFPIETALESTGLMDMRGYAVSLVPSEQKIEGSLYLSLEEQKRGIVGALYATEAITLETMAMAPADVNTANAFALDMAAFYDAMIGILNQTVPMAAAYPGMLSLNVASQYEVDPINQILRNIAGEHLLYQRQMDEQLRANIAQQNPELAALQVSQAYFLALRNGPETFAAIQKLLTNLKADPNAGSVFEMEEDEGLLIITPAGEQANAFPLKPAAVVNPRYIAFTNNEVELQNVLRAMKGTLTETLAAGPDYQRAVAGLEMDSLATFAYTPKEGMTQAFDMMANMVQMIPQEAADFDPALLPSSAVASRYLGDSWSSLRLLPSHMEMKIVINGAE